MLTFAILFLILQVCNLVFAVLRFDKNRVLASILELLIPIIGIVFNSLFGFTQLFLLGFIGSFLASGVMIAPAVIRKSKYDWSKYVLIATSIVGVVLSIIYGGML